MTNEWPGDERAKEEECDCTMYECKCSVDDLRAQLTAKTAEKDKTIAELEAYIAKEENPWVRRAEAAEKSRSLMKGDYDKERMMREDAEKALAAAQERIKTLEGRI